MYGFEFHKSRCPKCDSMLYYTTVGYPPFPIIKCTLCDYTDEFNKDEML